MNEVLPCSDPRCFPHITDTSYLSPGLFCLALIKLYELIFDEFSSVYPIKNDFIGCLKHWCNILKMLAHIGNNKRVEFYEKAIAKVDPVEIDLLTSWRNMEPFSSFSLEDEIWLYKTLIRLF